MSTRVANIITAAAAGATLMDDAPSKTKSAPRRRFRFGMRSLLLFVLTASVAAAYARRARLDRTAVLLQELIEARLLADPADFAALERNGPTFRRFAFETHPVAYWEAGIAELPIRDLMLIYFTPDLEDILSGEGRRQAAIVTDRLLAAWQLRIARDPGFLLDKIVELVTALWDADVHATLSRRLFG